MRVIGPPRSGKGTVGRIVTALIGADSVAAPSFSTLGSHFGVAALIGKHLAIVPDARLSGRADQAVIVERLLSISGEDRIEVDRKHRASWTGTLPTRLMLLANEVPKLRDASLALANRLIILRLTESFLGREDPGLTDRLRLELPGIFNWAVEGWIRLHRRGHFEPPRSSRGLVRELEDIASPVARFVKDRCVAAPTARVTVHQLYHAFRGWCGGQGTLVIPEISMFGRDLRAVVPSLSNRQPTIDGRRTRGYRGIGLREEVGSP